MIALVEGKETVSTTDVANGLGEEYMDVENGNDEAFVVELDIKFKIIVESYICETAPVNVEYRSVEVEVEVEVKVSAVIESRMCV